MTTTLAEGDCLCYFFLRHELGEHKSHSASAVVISHHLTPPILELFSYYAVNGEIAVSARL